MDTQVAEDDHYRILHVHPSAHPAVITAAYRALARLVHPDRSGEPTEHAMSRLSRAYAVLRDPEQRKRYDTERARAAIPVEPAASSIARTVPQPPPGPSRGSQLRYGRYQGWSLDQLVRHDPDYLRWLARHTSGRHHRAEIERLFSARPPAASRS